MKTDVAYGTGGQAAGEPRGLAARFVRRIEGCYFNVMGLPVSALYRLLRRLGR